MMPARQPAGGGRAVGGRDEQFVGPEKGLFLAADGHAQNLEQGAVEAAAGLDVAHHQVQVVDQTTAMKMLRFHGDSFAR